MAAESPRKHLKFVNNVVRPQAFRYVFIKTHLFRTGSSLTNIFPKNTVFNPYNSYSWTSCLFSTLNTIKEIHKESLKQWTYNTHMIASKLKKIREMLLTTLEHNQHDKQNFKSLRA
jgi:hypothetical protein